MKDKVVVDVSCGRGGGTNFIANHFKPKKIYGVDFCRHQIEYSKSNFHANVLRIPVASPAPKPEFTDMIVDEVPQTMKPDDSTYDQTLEYKYADAEYLSANFKADSVDCVVNVESSHCYVDKDQFFEEVYTVLKDPKHH